MYTYFDLLKVVLIPCLGSSHPSQRNLILKDMIFLSEIVKLRIAYRLLAQEVRLKQIG
jgi:hypothetical protein